jgi:low affinity Fe/Cu permease
MSSAAAYAKAKPVRRDTVKDANHAARKAVDKIDAPSPSSGFARFSNRVAHAMGKPITFAIAVVVILVWAVTGPIFHYSDTWQLIINTGTTIVTFLMVFLIQNTQNRDGVALQAKLDELIRAHQDARDAYMGIEKLDEVEVEKMREDCEEAARAEQPEKKRENTKAA